MTALGFDPAPGDLLELASLSRACTGLSLELADDARRARAMRDLGVWTGQAAEAFRHCVGTLPQELDRASEAFDEAALALAKFGSALEGQQRLARDLVRQLEAPKLDAMARDDLVRQAQSLRHAVAAQASRTNRVLEHATRHAPRPPSWFAQELSKLSRDAQRVNDQVGAFVRDHAAALAALSAVCSEASSALAVTAMLLGPIPVLGEAVGGLALTGSLVAGGVALLGHTALATYAGGSWGTVAFDAVALATVVAPSGVEAVAGRVATRAGWDLGEQTTLGAAEALSTVRHPLRAIASGADAAARGSTMTFPALVTRTITYQFDLTGGALGIVDLSHAGDIAAEVDRAQREADHRTAELADAR